MGEPRKPVGATRVGALSPSRRLAHLAVSLFQDLELRSPRTLLLVWSVGRLTVFLVWGVFTPETQGDVVYYFQHINNMFSVGPELTMQEYPTPVLWMLVGSVLVVAAVALLVAARRGGTRRAGRSSDAPEPLPR